MAFRHLFDYISSENRTKTSIAMTAPVNQQQSEGKYVVSFLMPSKYMMETLPEPLNPDVKLRALPARKMAAIRYAGSWSRKKYETKKALLEEFIQKKGLTVTGPDIFARYDSPFQLPFLRRNEVLFPVD